MAVFEIKFPHIKDGSELKAKVFTRGDFGKQTTDIDDKRVPRLSVGIIPGWGVRPEALYPLAQGMLDELSEREAVLVTDPDYSVWRPVMDLDKLRVWHKERMESALGVMEEGSLLMPYSKACVSVSDAVVSLEKKEFVVAYLQGPFFSRPISNVELAKRFLQEGLSRAISPGNWIALFDYSAGLLQGARPKELVNELMDSQLIAGGVDLNRISDRALAFQSEQDCLFPYSEARESWDRIGRAGDVVELEHATQAGHLLPMREPGYTAVSVISHLRRRFGQQVI